MLNTKELEQMQFFANKVAEVHWPEHGEYIEINDLVKNIEYSNDVTDEVFEKLRELTNNYIIPEGACNAQNTLLNLLKKLDSNIL